MIATGGRKTKTKKPNNTMKTTRNIRSLRSRGFTLIELLVVISIIAILAGFALPVFANAQRKGRLTDSMSACKQIATAMRLYAGDNGGSFVATDTDGTTALASADPSNKAFNSLMGKLSQNKKVFLNKTSAWCLPAQTPDTTPAQMADVRAQQNDWMYICGLNDSSDARFPLVATATKASGDYTYTNVTSAKGGVWGGTDAIVGFVDGSAKQYGGGELNTTTPTATYIKNPNDVTANGKLLEPTATWMGAPTTTLFAMWPL